MHSGWSRPVSQTLLSPFHSLLRRSFQFVELVFLWEYHHIVCDNKRESAQDYWCFQNKKTKRHTENLSDHKTSSVLQYMVSRHIIHQTNPKISSTKIRYEHTSDPQAPNWKEKRTNPLLSAFFDCIKRAIFNPHWHQLEYKYEHGFLRLKAFFP